MNLRKNIIDHLKDKGNYSSDVDDYVIDMLLENIEFSKQAKEDIEENGLIVTICAGNGHSYTKMNPAFGIYQMCLRNINQCSSKLGINRKDRIALKLIEEKEIDQFDVEFR